MTTTALHALAVDDNDNSLEVISQLLNFEGIGCTTLQDPSQVLQTLATLDRVDLAFIDLEMPHIDGYAVFKTLRSQLGKRARLICWTVHISEINNVRRAGFDGFLSKPLDSDRFPEQLRRILSGQSVWELA